MTGIQGRGYIKFT